ncbi:hypothetical protein KSF73_17030 [Burkholderiaceae bacterium DAT-1]|nr:hypothetical protein [Burkholderiaceae bacterium DAT-1]
MKPGSVLWLLKWELKLSFREMMSGSKQQAIALWVGIALSAVLFLVLAAMAAGLFYLIDFTPQGAKLIDELGTTALGIAWLALLFVNLLISMQRTLAVLFERGDMDLLMSSPIPVSRLLTVRSIGIVLNAIYLPLWLVVPFSLVGIGFGHFNLIAMFPALLAMGAISSVPAMLSIIWLARRFGAKRAKHIAQRISVFVSIGFVLLMQLPNILIQSGKGDQLAHFFSQFKAPAQAVCNWLGYAIVGSPQPLLGLILIGGGAFAWTIHLGKRQFGALTQADIAQSPHTGTQIDRVSFDLRLPSLVFRKEWKLILREPQLLMMTLMPPMLMCLTIIGQIVGKHADKGLTMMTGMMVFIFAITASNLVWMAVALDEGHALLASAPADIRRIRKWQLISILIPILISSLLPLGLVASHDMELALRLGLATWIGSIVCGIQSRARSRPIPRSKMKKNMGRSGFETLYDMAAAGVWVAAASSFTGVSIVGAAIGLSMLGWSLYRERTHRFAQA